MLPPCRPAQAEGCHPLHQQKVSTEAARTKVAGVEKTSCSESSVPFSRHQIRLSTTLSAATLTRPLPSPPQRMHCSRLQAAVKVDAAFTLAITKKFRNFKFENLELFYNYKSLINLKIMSSSAFEIMSSNYH